MNDILEKTLLLDFYGKLLTDKQRDMYKCKYEEDMSLAEIALLYGISRQGVSEAIKNADKILLDYESKLKLVNRFKKLEDIIDKVDTLISNDLNKDKEIENNKIEKDNNKNEELILIKKELDKIRKWNNGI